MEYLGDNKPVNQITPLVSVCITTYQHAGLIQQCLDSVLMQQTDFDFEIIVGEDDSTDGTRNICKEYAEKHPDKIRLFLRSREDVIYLNRTPSNRFNYIENLKAARGTYLAFCDGDDYWTDKKKLQNQVNLFQSDQRLSFVFHKAHKINDEGEVITPIPPNPPPIRNGIMNKNYFIMHGTKNFASSSMCITRRVIENLPQWTYVATGGDMFISLLAATYGDIGYIDRVMSIYRYSYKRGWRSRVYKDKRSVARLIIQNIRSYTSYLMWSHGKNAWPVLKCIILQKYMLFKLIFRKI